MVEIFHDETGNVVKKLGPHTKRKAEKIEDGASINLSGDYSTRIVPWTPEVYPE